MIVIKRSGVSGSTTAATTFTHTVRHTVVQSQSCTCTVTPKESLQSRTAPLAIVRMQTHTHTQPLQPLSDNPHIWHPQIPPVIARERTHTDTAAYHLSPHTLSLAKPETPKTLVPQCPLPLQWPWPRRGHSASGSQILLPDPAVPYKNVPLALRHDASYSPESVGARTGSGFGYSGHRKT